MKPEVGTWYSQEGLGVFEVTNVEEDSETIEIQMKNGNIEEMSLEDWNGAAASNSLTKIDSPEEEFEDEDEEFEEDDEDEEFEEEEEDE